MDVVVTVEHRFTTTPDGCVWTNGALAYSFWSRYLEAFGHVHVVARVAEAAKGPVGGLRADGAGVSFRPVPYYVGPLQYVLRRNRIRRSVRASVESTDAIIFRLASPVAACLDPALRATRRPYGVEVVGDPWDVFAPGAVRHPLRFLLRRVMMRQLRRQCAGACAAAYVTARALQRRYPVGPGAFSTHYSDVLLASDSFAAAPRLPGSTSGARVVVTVGSLEQPYKGMDVLIRAVASCIPRGTDLSLTIIGGGKHLPTLRELSRDLGLDERIIFLGQFKGPGPVAAELDRADLFVLPSRTEGLPRAMIEAMARGLPCIGSDVGGIPELLPPDDLVPPGEVEPLARKIERVLGDPERMARMSARNLEEAASYREDRLRARRVAFYTYVRDRTRDWRESGTGA